MQSLLGLVPIAFKLYDIYQKQSADRKELVLSKALDTIKLAEAVLAKVTQEDDSLNTMRLVIYKRILELMNLITKAQTSYYIRNTLKEIENLTTSLHQAINTLTSGLILKECESNRTTRVKVIKISRLESPFAEESPQWIFENMDYCGNNIFSYKAKDSSVPRLWFKRSEITWVWTPYDPQEPSELIWIPANQLVVPEGRWIGATPSEANVKFIKWLDENKPKMPAAFYEQVN